MEWDQATHANFVNIECRVTNSNLSPVRDQRTSCGTNLLATTGGNAAAQTGNQASGCPSMQVTLNDHFSNQESGNYACTFFRATTDNVLAGSTATNLKLKQTIKFKPGYKVFASAAATTPLAEGNTNTYTGSYLFYVTAEESGAITQMVGVGVAASLILL